MYGTRVVSSKTGVDGDEGEDVPTDGAELSVLPECRQSDLGCHFELPDWVLAVALLDEVEADGAAEAPLPAPLLLPVVDVSRLGRWLAELLCATPSGRT